MSRSAALQRLREADLRLFRRISGWRSVSVPSLRPRPPTASERILPALSRAANMSKLWIGIGAALFALGERTGKRAAVRGLGSIAATSAVVNAVFKPLVKRKRPALQGVPAVRRLRQPRSASFPSGHAASAAAFAVGVGLERPRIGLLVAPLAAAVGYSRSFVGAHYPGDVAGGWIIGAATALLTRAAWPTLPSPGEIVQDAPAPRDLPRAPRGEGVALVFNPRSGSRIARPSKDDLRALLPAARIHEIGEGESPQDAVARALADAEIVGVCGGDGTLLAAAQGAIASGKPLLLIPGGTMNHLAHDLGLRRPEDSVTALARGHGVAIDYATVAGEPFLNNASLGLYSAVIEEREELEPRVGRWPAHLLATARAIRRQRPIEVELDGDSRAAWLVFVGNGGYQERGLLPGWRRSLDDGTLDIRVLPRRGRAPRLAALLSALTGATIERRRAPQLVLDSAKPALRFIRDGEPLELCGEVVFQSHRRQLTVYARRD